MMSWTPSSRDSEPYAYVRGVAVDFTIALIVLHVVAMVAASILLAMGYGSWLQHLVYTVPSSVQGWKVWQLLFYSFHHNITMEGIWFAVNMLMLGWFGRGVERHIGKMNFFFMYLMMTVVPALLIYSFFKGGALVGVSEITFGIFIAYTIIYPRAELFFGILAKWAAVVLLAIYSLVYLVKHDWFSCTVMWTTVASAYVCLQFYGVGQWFEFYHSWQTTRAARRLEKRRQRLQHAEENFHQSVDYILEKISREGIDSLTKAERDHLEEARARLLREEKK